jgi:hypothetical protein
VCLCIESYNSSRWLLMAGWKGQGVSRRYYDSNRPFTPSPRSETSSSVCAYMRLGATHVVFTRAKVLLPLSGIAVALLLGVVGSRQRPTGLQDDSPFVAPAIGVCEAINDPATLLLGALLLFLAHSIHFELGFSRTPIPQIFFLGAVALLWFAIGIEVDLRLTKKTLAGHRVVAASVAIAVIVALAWFCSCSMAPGAGSADHRMCSMVCRPDALLLR